MKLILINKIHSFPSKEHNEFSIYGIQDKLDEDIKFNVDR